MSNFFSRRQFLRSMGGAAAAFPILSAAASEEENRLEFFDCWSVDKTFIRFHSSKIKTPVRVLFITDTHLYRDDQRGEPYRQYSDRMAHAYNETTDYQTGSITNPEESFLKTLSRINKFKPDVILLLGDIISFPSEAGLEWFSKALDETQIPWYFISGNHDWHYEGLPGTDIALRNEWTHTRLAPLYHHQNPLYYAVEVNGLNIVMIDNSVYEILPEQLEFFRRQVSSGKPSILGMHIPLYVPQRPVGYGCGHPDWNAASDVDWQTERREKWPETGHTQVTYNFWKEVFSVPNLLAVFAGHIHEPSIDIVNNIPQFVVPTNSDGNFRLAAFLPYGE